MHRNRITLAVTFALVAAAVPASATTYTFAWIDQGTGAFGTSKTFLENGMDVTAYVFNTDGTTTGNGLFGKNLGADEIGLGTTADASGQDEIVFADYVMLDFSDVKKNFNITSATLRMSSVQSPDNWEWFGTPTKPARPTLASPGTAFRTGATTPPNDENAYDILSRLNSGSNFISIHGQFNSSSGNVLLGQLILNAVPKTPEPVTSSLMAGSLAGLIWLRRRAARRASVKFGNTASANLPQRLRYPHRHWYTGRVASSLRALSSAG